MSHPERRDIGISADVAARVSAHNAGQNRATARWTPWDVELLAESRTERLAHRFEKYLKSGAGHELARRHLSAMTLS